jgi:hypothetical protein
LLDGAAATRRSQKVLEAAAELAAAQGDDGVTLSLLLGEAS